MEEAARSFILLLTFLILIYMAAHQPKPVEVSEVRYCNGVRYWRWVEFEGERVKLWYRGYGLCSDVDDYEVA